MPLPAPVLLSRTTRTASTAPAPKCWITASSCNRGMSKLVGLGECRLMRELCGANHALIVVDAVQAALGAINALSTHISNHPGSHKLASTSCARLPTNRERSGSNTTAPLPPLGVARSTRMCRPSHCRQAVGRRVGHSRRQQQGWWWLAAASGTGSTAGPLPLRSVSPCQSGNAAATHAPLSC